MQELELAPRLDDEQPIGLRWSLAVFASIFVVATPTEAVKPVSARIRVRSAAAISGPDPESRRAAHVEEGLVERDRLDEG